MSRWTGAGRCSQVRMIRLLWMRNVRNSALTTHICLSATHEVTFCLSNDEVLRPSAPSRDTKFWSDGYVLKIGYRMLYSIGQCLNSMQRHKWSRRCTFHDEGQTRSASTLSESENQNGNTIIIVYDEFMARQQSSSTSFLNGITIRSHGDVIHDNERAKDGKMKHSRMKGKFFCWMSYLCTLQILLLMMDNSFQLEQ